MPEPGDLVRVRGQQWIVTDVRESRLPEDEFAAKRLPGRTLVTMSSVSDDDLGEDLTVVWEIEPDRENLPASKLPEVIENGFDDPQKFGAFLDAVRWGAVASADTNTLQAPFRSGITVEEYQLEPVARVLKMPRVNLLIADDVGLGKTIEAGLVAQEMILRHRARRVLVVCPAPLTLKWRDEMSEKFGLDFEVLNAEKLREVRRNYGLQANPFSVFPRTIVSLQWLRTPRVQRLLDEVLSGESLHRGFFDLLIVDEAHHVAPPAPRNTKGYSVDSQQTQAVRRIAEHSRHRLFLSATPHNGYRESWQALLEMLDPQRFARGVEPDPKAVDEVMVRRLKTDLTNDDGSAKFPGRSTRAIEIDYAEAEVEGHALLSEYTAERTRIAKVMARGRKDERGTDLVTLLLKKRMFSSPAAFARTLDAHSATVKQSTGPHTASLSSEYEDVLDWDEMLLDDEASDEAQREFLDRVEPGQLHNSSTDELLAALHKWTASHRDPADTKALSLVAELEATCKTSAGGDSGERVIVFTEYVDTQLWLAGILEARGLGGERLGLLSGATDERQREHLKAAFQASPDRDPVRILLATDAASEGIDLQRHCHRVIHYDIPFNPNRLEQRIGRVDRHGQKHVVDVAHFVGAGWSHAKAGSYVGDLEYLSRVAAKVATEKEDLGSVNPVLAGAIEARMLGRPLLVDPTVATKSPQRQFIKAERDVREQLARLRAQLKASSERLHVAPGNVLRVVETALEIASQPALVEAGERAPGEFQPPTLRGGWERTVAGLADPLSGEPRPLTFDQNIAADRDDVVLAHLEFPLVAQSTRLLRSAIWGNQSAIHRVTAVEAKFVDDTDVDGLLVAVMARLVVVGVDGTRLHEEVMLTGRVVQSDGKSAVRSQRLELEKPKNGAVRVAVENALDPDRCIAASDAAKRFVVDAWSQLEVPLAGDIEARRKERVGSLAASLARRADEDRKRVNGVLDHLDNMLRAALKADDGSQPTFDDLEREERDQWEKDRAAWRQRLEGIAEQRQRELDAIDERFREPRELVFPFAIAILVPEGWTA